MDGSVATQIGWRSISLSLKPSGFKLKVSCTFNR